MSTLKKQRTFLEDLLKLDPSLSEALSAMRATPGLAPHANVVARHLFADTMVPKMGNKLAYTEHLARHGNDGTHVHVDMNDFGQINKLHGEAMGDHAIKSFGSKASELSRTFGGKAFRNGGDEFKFWFAKPEHAHGFARELRRTLEGHEKIGGTHNLSAALGIGHNPGHAETALLGAKGKLGTMGADGKRVNTHALGNAPTVIHSLTHEPTPPNWKVGIAKPTEGVPPESKSLVPHGVELHNPLMGKSEQNNVVWRVQNVFGQGPYEFYSGPRIEALDSEDSSRWPSPMDDFDPKHNVDADHRYGFASPVHAKAWFGEKELGLLDSHGFKLQQVQAQRIVPSKSGKQVAFKPQATGTPTSSSDE